MYLEAFFQLRLGKVILKIRLEKQIYILFCFFIA
jgi:hypothetical protein